METPRPTPQQSQLLVNSFAIHSGYERPPKSPSARPASVAAPAPNNSSSTKPSQDPPLGAKPVSSPSYMIQGMGRFERDVSEELQRRFKDVSTRLAEPLAAYLRKSRHEHRPVVIRLMFLGNDRDSARPWIVVLCPESVKKRAEKFFKKDMAQRIYHSDEPGRESFQVAVIGHAPRPLAGEVQGFVEASTRSGYSCWSSQIKAKHRGTVSYATMGGYIVIQHSYDSAGNIYGLTAGHIIDHTEVDSASLEEPLEGSMPSPASTDSENEDMPVLARSSSIHTQVAPESPAGHESAVIWICLGISTMSYTDQARDRDWALIEGTGVTQLDTLEAGEIDTLVVQGTIGDLQSLQIGFGGEFDLDCTLSRTVSMILTPSGHNFVKAHILVPDSCKRLRSGASGAWVTSRSGVLGDQPILSVYGHVVADDIFGDVYMIPMCDIIKDIYTATEAVEVRLPSSMKEVRRIVSENSQRAQAKSRYESNSKDRRVTTSDVTTDQEKSGSSAIAGMSDEFFDVDSYLQPSFTISEDLNQFPRDGTHWPPLSSTGYVDNHDYDDGAEEENDDTEEDIADDSSLGIGYEAPRMESEALWAPGEDRRLKNMRDRGDSWSQIMEEFPDRAEGDVKKHWYRELHHGSRVEKRPATSIRGGTERKELRKIRPKRR